MDKINDVVDSDISYEQRINALPPVTTAFCQQQNQNILFTVITHILHVLYTVYSSFTMSSIRPLLARQNTSLIQNTVTSETFQANSLGFYLAYLFQAEDLDVEFGPDALLLPYPESMRSEDI